VIVGAFRDDLPWISLQLPGIDHAFTVEFVVDSGFQGDFALPPHLINRTHAQFSYRSARLMADGSHRQCDVYVFDIEWNGKNRTVEVLILDGNPLLGTLMMHGGHLSIDVEEGGEVIIEFL